MQNCQLRVAAYARVSTDRDDQVNSFASQKSYFADYIRNHKEWEMSGIYFDEGASGTQTQNRAGFNQMIEDALSGKFDLILTKEVCRFARNTVDTLSYTRRLREAGVGVVFTIDNIDTRDSDGELRLTIMASIAQEESRKTSERVKWGQRRRMEQGVVFGRDMLGYIVKEGSLYINEEEVQTVRAIFHKYTNEGKGACVIARELTEEGLRPKRLSSWSNTVILRVLRNEKYVGDLCQKKTYTPNYLTHKKKYNKGAEEKIYIKNHHAPIIDRELWNRTQKEIERRSLAVGEKEKHSNRYWCSGKIYCGECGSRFVSRTKKLVSGTYRAWRCSQAAGYSFAEKEIDGNQVKCGNHFMNDKALLACMNYCMWFICQDAAKVRKEVLAELRRISKTEEPAFDREKIIRKIEGLEVKKRKAFDVMLEGAFSREEFKKQLEWYDNERERLEHMLDAEKQRIENCGRQGEAFNSLEKALDEILVFQGNNEMLYREILEKIVIYKETEKGCGCLVIWLKYLPFGICLKIKSAGKGEEYHTDIYDMSIVDAALKKKEDDKG